MDGIGRDDSGPWASWGDLVVVLTALLLGLLGLIRHGEAPVLLVSARRIIDTSDLPGEGP